MEAFETVIKVAGGVVGSLVATMGALTRPIRRDLRALTARVQKNRGDLDELVRRVTALEQRPSGPPSDGALRETLAAHRAEVVRLGQVMDVMRDEIRGLVSDEEFQEFARSVAERQERVAETIGYIRGRLKDKEPRR